MVAVIINTKSETSRIDWACEDAGANMFVGLSGGGAGSANPAGADAQIREVNPNATLDRIGPGRLLIVLLAFAVSASIEGNSASK